MKKARTLLATALVSSGVSAEAAPAAVFTCAAPETERRCVVTTALTQSDNGLGLQPFFLARHLYLHVFYSFELMDVIALEDKRGIVRAMAASLSDEEAVALNVEGHAGGNFVVSLRILPPEMVPPEKGKIVTLISNLDSRTGSVARTEEALKHARAYFYYVVGDRIVESSSMHDPAEEQKRVAAKDKRGLAELYLHDERPENDAKISPLLDEALAEAPSSAAKAGAYMSRVEYQLFRGEADAARRTLADWKAYAESVPAGEKAEVLRFHKAGAELVEIVGALASPSAAPEP